MWREYHHEGEEENFFSFNARIARENLKILRRPGAKQAIDDLVDEMVNKSHDRGPIYAVARTLYSAGRMMATPALVGAVFGAMTGDMERARDGAIYGATLSVIGNSAMYAIVVLPRRLSKGKLSKEFYRQVCESDVLQKLKARQTPLLNIVSGGLIGLALYLGISAGLDLLLPNDNFLGVIKVDNGMAARVGVMAGVISQVREIVAGRKLYESIEARLSRASGVVEGSYRVEEPKNTAISKF